MTIALRHWEDLSLATPFVRLSLSDTRGVWCIVSARHWDWIAEKRWNWGWHRGTPWKHYAKRNVGAARSTVYLHREIMIRNDPRNEVFQSTHFVHHKNGQSLDNRDENLAWATPGENARARIRRADVPSLQSIIRDLIATVPALDLQEVPF